MSTHVRQSTLDTSIAALVETFVHLGVQVHDFQGTPEARAGLASHIIRSLQQLAQLSQQLPEHSEQIPADLVAYVRDGRNPDIYSREFVEVVRRVAQWLNGKQQAWRSFQAVLASNVAQEFPELAGVAQYIVERTR